MRLNELDDEGGCDVDLLLMLELDEFVDEQKVWKRIDGQSEYERCTSKKLQMQRYAEPKNRAAKRCR